MQIHGRRQNEKRENFRAVCISQPGQGTTCLDRTILLWIFFGIQKMSNEKVSFILQRILINIQITFIISHTNLHPFRLHFYFIAALILKFK